METPTEIAISPAIPYAVGITALISLSIITTISTAGLQRLMFPGGPKTKLWSIKEWLHDLLALTIVFAPLTIIGFLSFDRLDNFRVNNAIEDYAHDNNITLQKVFTLKNSGEVTQTYVDDDGKRCEVDIEFDRGFGFLPGHVTFTPGACVKPDSNAK